MFKLIFEMGILFVKEKIKNNLAAGAWVLGFTGSRSVAHDRRCDGAQFSPRAAATAVSGRQAGDDQRHLNGSGKAPFGAALFADVFFAHVSGGRHIVPGVGRFDEKVAVSGLELLLQIGVAHRLLEIDVDESIRPDEAPADYVLRVSQDKALAGLESCHGAEFLPVLAADTTVVVDGCMLGKPADRTAGIRFISTRAAA